MHHLYARLPDRRAALRRELQFLLLDAELAQADGVQEALEFYAGVLKGVALPLRAEHRAFLQRCLLPLLKRPQGWTRASACWWRRTARWACW